MTNERSLRKTLLLTALMLVASSLASCGATLAVRVEGPKGTMVKIGSNEPAQVPFTTQIRRSARVRLELGDDVLREIGCTDEDIQKARSRRSTNITGSLRLAKSRDRRATLRFEADSLKQAVLDDAVFRWRWVDTSGRQVLTFEGRAEIPRE